tara:strand:+ start:429 stop:656 length:228 start_codon:yes stop_codon:yes gene_type:complete
MRDITEHIDDYCEEWYGHRNWEYMNNEKDKFYDQTDVAEFMLVKILVDPHSKDGDCLCEGSTCLKTQEECVRFEE